jgi:hypothetical protein
MAAASETSHLAPAALLRYRTRQAAEPGFGQTTALSLSQAICDGFTGLVAGLCRPSGFVQRDDAAGGEPRARNPLQSSRTCSAALVAVMGDRAVAVPAALFLGHAEAVAPVGSQAPCASR